MNMVTKFKNPMAVVTRKTGLNAHVIRAWEKRYGAVSPVRTQGNHRMYSDEDVERLLLLKRVIASGRSIGQVARLSKQELYELAEPETVGVENEREPSDRPAPDISIHEYLEACTDAVDRLDPTLLAETLYRCSINHGQIRVIEGVIDPLMDDIGKRWNSGRIRILHEHMASAVIRTYLGNVLNSLDFPEAAPKAVTTTPAGERHEIGALTATVAASIEGWNVLYLGPNLPAEDIIKAADLAHAQAVILSITVVSDQNRIFSEISRLRTYLRPDAPVLIGGRVLDHHRKLIEQPGVLWIENISELRKKLHLIQSGHFSLKNQRDDNSN
jgi:DNA-binding transcriptional MerR regulator/methylmalonyl-CoA mutase cobalamin-binding subunit